MRALNQEVEGGRQAGGIMNDLLREWTRTYDAMEAAVRGIAEELARDAATIADQIRELQAKLDEISVPYNARAAEIEADGQSRLAELEAQIYPLACEHGRTYAYNGARVAFRAGYVKVTFEAARTDTVLATLRDVLPSTAAALAAARKETHVAPSVKIERAA
jgi:hypothetical protein